MQMHLPTAEMHGHAIPDVAFAALLVGGESNVVGRNHRRSAEIPKRPSTGAAVLIRLGQTMLAFLKVSRVPITMVRFTVVGGDQGELVDKPEMIQYREQGRSANRRHRGTGKAVFFLPQFFTRVPWEIGV